MIIIMDCGFSKFHIYKKTVNANQGRMSISDVRGENQSAYSFHPLLLCRLEELADSSVRCWVLFVHSTTARQVVWCELHVFYSVF